MAMMMRKRAKTAATASRSKSRYSPYKGKLEYDVAAQLAGEGVAFAYEGKRLPYLPNKPSYYVLDFHQFPNSNIVIETKGWFRTSRERTRFLAIREQYPDLDIRFVFSDPNKKISKGSNTSYADWCDKYGFKYAAKQVPQAWIEELKAHEPVHSS